MLYCENLNYCDVKFYLELKKNEPDKTKFPFCVDIILEPMTMANQRIYVQSSHYRVYPCQMHYRNPNPNSVPYYPDMPARENPDLDPVEGLAQGNPLMCFAVECVGDDLEDQSQFNTALLVEEETNTGVNNASSNGARSTISSCSVGGIDGDGTMNNCGTE